MERSYDLGVAQVVRLLFFSSVYAGCVIMTAFEIISIFIGILTLLVTFGSLIVAFLAFLTRDKDHKN